MPRTLLIVPLAVLASSHLLAQITPGFEVATVKPAPSQSDGRTQTRMSSDTDKGQLTYSNVNLKEVIGRAYKVQQYQITGPDWLETERFDISARFAPHSSTEQLGLMLQALLADRFKLALHHETKELPVYSLTVIKGGPKFKSSETASGITSNSNRTQWHVTAKVSMDRFAEFLTGEAGRPVLDKTGLPGSYDLKLDWSPDTAPASADAAPSLPSLFTALQEQLGLKLEPAKGPVDMLVVDRAERVPTDN
ncbi:MAG TPA: TIGR03435 family protein [Bryobacteraceae bacterium]|jgi:uncharacterized protein (TIGR03435 family)